MVATTGAEATAHNKKSTKSTRVQYFIIILEFNINILPYIWEKEAMVQCNCMDVCSVNLLWMIINPFFEPSP